MSESPQRHLVITEPLLPTKDSTAVWFGAVYRRIVDWETPHRDGRTDRLPELRKQVVPVRHALTGIGEDLDYLTGQAHELGVVDRVHLLGHVRVEDLAHWYNACD
jgi:hypothetical protein